VALRRTVLGALAIIGWTVLLIALFNSAVSQVREWLAPGPCDVRNPDGWPQDDLAEALEYPNAVCYHADKQRRMARFLPLYPLVHSLSLSQSACAHPSNLAGVVHQLIEQKELRANLELHVPGKPGELMHVNMARLRYSLQQHIWQLKEDYLCAQHLGIPLCYCVWKRSSGSRYHWEDMLGLVNMTCLSNKTMMLRAHGTDPLCAGKPRDAVSVMYRFKTACLQYYTPQNELVDRQFSKEASAVAQDIFLLQRGLRNCSYDEVAQGSDGVMSAIWNQYHAEAL
jgi:hypothetical protein